MTLRTLCLDIEQADLDRAVEHRVLVVDGETRCNCRPGIDGSGWYHEYDCSSRGPGRPPAALVALAGKACGCECHGHNRPYPDMHDNGCPDCRGSGRALLGLRVKCETCGGPDAVCGICMGKRGWWRKDGPHDRWEGCSKCSESGRRSAYCPDCTDGYVTNWFPVEAVLPIWHTDDGKEHRGAAHICFVPALDGATGPWVLRYDADGNQVGAVDFGQPHSVHFIGRYAVLLGEPVSSQPRERSSAPGAPAAP